MAKNQQQIVQPQSTLSRALWRGALVLALAYGFAYFLDAVVLPRDGGRFAVEAVKVRESARGVLADAVEKTHAKIWK